MLPTPSTSHVDFARVYEPAEDSYLLLDTLSSPSESAALRARFAAPSPPVLAVEVGTGSGVVLAFVAAHAAAILGRGDETLVLGVDVNPFACRAASRTVGEAVIERRSGGRASSLGCVTGDLTSCLRPGQVDLLIFNPPYVPSEELPPPASVHETLSSFGVCRAPGEHERFVRDSKLLAIATDGGADGMEVTDRLLGELPAVLSPRGVAYVLLCARNKPDVIKQRIRGWEGGGKWTAETVGSSGRTGGWEKLSIVRISRQYT